MVLTIAGCRYPQSWSSGTKKKLYKMYGCFVFFLTHSLTISSVLDMIFNVRNQADFGENLYMSAPMVITCCKLYTLLANRDGIMILMAATRRKPYLPVDEEELRIETKFDTINE